MPRARRPQASESAYERRIRVYLEKHPGATRQEARGHRLPSGVRSEYAKRTAGTRVGSEERRVASGHRAVRDLERWLKRHGEGALVGIDPVGSTRDSQGRWTRLLVTVLDADGNERTFTVSPRKLRDREALRQLVQVIHDSGAIDSPLYPVAKLLDDGELEAAA